MESNSGASKNFPSPLTEPDNIAPTKPSSVKQRQSSFTASEGICIGNSANALNLLGFALTAFLSSLLTSLATAAAADSFSPTKCIYQWPLTAQESVLPRHCHPYPEFFDMMQRERALQHMTFRFDRIVRFQSAIAEGSALVMRFMAFVAALPHVELPTGCASSAFRGVGNIPASPTPYSYHLIGRHLLSMLETINLELSLLLPESSAEGKAIAHLSAFPLLKPTHTPIKRLNPTIRWSSIVLNVFQLNSPLSSKRIPPSTWRTSSTMVSIRILTCRGRLR